MKTNLLIETIEALLEHDKDGRDVRFVGDALGSATWDDFAANAKYVEYDRGLGAQEVSAGLLVVGDDWWLERHEYDGSEWWEFKALPIRVVGPGPKLMTYGPEYDL